MSDQGKLVSNPEHIRLGIIGMTEGNGHPFSWSAIFNGYDCDAMTRECPFPGIPAYLNKIDPAAIGIPGCHVTHVCCDDPKDAELVSRLSKVPDVVARPEEMLGKVDAVIIATDIGSEHVERARFFVENRIPLFIDKPLCDRVEDLRTFVAWVENGAKILSSSSMRYAKEYMPYHRCTEELGKLRFLSVTMSKKWETYGIHALESVEPITGPGYVSIRNLGDATKNLLHLRHRDGIDVVIACGKDICFGGPLCISGTQGSLSLRSTDSYTSFRNQLLAFADYLKTGIRPYPFEETVELMRLVIGGILSREAGSREVFLSEIR